MVFDEASEPVARRVAVGLHKLGLAMKQETWSQASGDKLSPTQGQILAALAAHGPSSGTELGSKLGVTLATISDSVKALAAKGLVAKARDPRHPRASLTSLTDEGRDAAKRVAGWPDFLATAVDTLSDAEREVMLKAIVKMIHALQESGHVPTDRMCISCEYFRPRVHEGALPHHCAFVDAPMADRHLRIDCAEHAPASAAQRAGAWQRFVSE